MISPFVALHFACPMACHPASDDPWKVKSGMKSWVAAKIAVSNKNTATSVEILVFVDIKCSLPGSNDCAMRNRGFALIATKIITAGGSASGPMSDSLAAPVSEVALIGGVDRRLQSRDTPMMRNPSGSVSHWILTMTR